MYCVNCGQQLPDHARFCPNCAHPAGTVTNEVQPAKTSGEPLLSVTNSAIVRVIPRTTVRVYEDRVLIADAYAARTHDTVLPYSKIAAVQVRAGLFFSELRIETTGGEVQTVPGLTHSQIKKARDLIDERL